MRPKAFLNGRRTPLKGRRVRTRGLISDWSNENVTVSVRLTWPSCRNAPCGRCSGSARIKTFFKVDGPLSDMMLVVTLALKSPLRSEPIFYFVATRVGSELHALAFANTARGCIC